ncbi:ATP-binding protein [Candidatus Solirubrobacter pratensis]|uniref:ATP-binding protein n=1 Tax=Candidatus Solirubrobacter pratensis TaxID=1298857 RepID=UPI000487242B|nr:ATP-binding protein [Candidatus Solirubrobacter pratensis]
MEDADVLGGIVRRQQGPDAVLLLGAGASVKSGVPLARDMVAMAAMWGWCRRNNRSFRDPRLTRSDWYPWLSDQGWFDADIPWADQYPTAVERLLTPRESRREFFLNVLDRAVTPSAGYEALAGLVGAGAVNHLLTTNFDALAIQACRADRGVSRVELIRRPADLHLFSLAPRYPQVVQLHGSVEHYEDRNLETETRTLDPLMRDAVLPLLRDHPLVVIGYRGAEPSVMEDLLLRGVDQVNGYRHGIYWCMLPGETPSPLVEKLAQRVGANFAFVEIPGFDEAMTEWARDLRPARVPRVSSSDPEPVSDLRPVELSVDELDQVLLVERLDVYAERMDLPPAEDDSAREQRLEEMRLVRRRDDGGAVLTRAAMLLFSAEDVVRVEITAGEVFLPVAGNALVVLDRVLDALDELNETYRLKGATSEDVRRFDPRAIKEVVVNALAHRDYDVDAPVRIRMSSRELTIVSPGGVVEGLRPELLGERGQRAYRNPVLADLLYGIGAMDKRGSGLPDVLRWARQAGGEATFGVTHDARSFVASLIARDLDPDPVTGTASPEHVERFTVNALPVELRGALFRTRSSITDRTMVFDAAGDGAPVPGFAFDAGELYTFDDPSSDGSPFAAFLLGEPATVPAGDLLGRPESERVLVQLLNSCLLAWSRDRQLRSDAGAMRFWFPRDEDGERAVTYRARVRESRRAVTRPKVSNASGAVRYWEHEAVRVRFRRYGDQWVVHLVPTMVFTTDGEADLLVGPRVGPLATRRLARDFNPQVQNDIYFWRWVLVGGDEHVDLGAGSVRVGSRLLVRDVIDAPPATGGLGAEPEEDVVERDVASELAEIAAEQAEERE